MRHKKSLLLHTKSEQETIALGKRIAQCISNPQVIALHGTLGSGKTTLTKGLVAGFFPRRKIVVKSPSFALVNQYQGTYTINHIDCYRLDDEGEFIDIGIDEFLYSSGITIIEWPEKIKKLLPKEALHIRIKASSETERSLQFDAPSKMLRSLRSKLCT